MKIILALVAALALSACATKAPPYQPSIPNVQKLQAAGPVKLGTFTVADPKLEKISLRASTMSADNGYGEYLKQALAQELALAKKQDANASCTVSGELLENDLDSSGLSVGRGKIKARFVVTQASKEVYKKDQVAELTWESSFVGAIAIPAATNSYPMLVQKLLGTLFDDPEFIAATK